MGTGGRATNHENIHVGKSVGHCADCSTTWRSLFEKVRNKHLSNTIVSSKQVDDFQTLYCRMDKLSLQSSLFHEEHCPVGESYTETYILYDFRRQGRRIEIFSKFF